MVEFGLTNKQLTVFIADTTETFPLFSHQSFQQLMFSFQERLKLVTVLGAGLLCGTALAVIVPEGVHALYEDILEGENRRCRNLRPCLELGPEAEDSSPGLTWILGYFWSLPRRFSPHLEWGHARALSSRALEPVSVFPARRSRDLWLSLWAFPPSFPNRLSHRAVPSATVVWVDHLRECRGSAGKTGVHGMD